MASTMLHVRIDKELKEDAASKLKQYGLSLSDAVRILLTRISHEGGLPAVLTMDEKAYDDWFRARVHEALEDSRATLPHQQVMDEVRELIERKRSG